jgi:hypothetical protein
VSPKAFPAPEPGDIVWCRFPNMEEIRPGPKPRPALVLSVDDERIPARVRVAYGTSRGTDEVAPWEIVVRPDDGEAYRLAGVNCPTKFSMLKVVVLDYTSHWFGIAPGVPAHVTPRMGVLHPSLVARAHLAHQSASRHLEKRSGSSSRKA